jgi:hypothetical protein
MSPDDIDSLALDLHAFLVSDMMGLKLDEDADYATLRFFLYKQLDKFIVRDRNYN